MFIITGNNKEAKYVEVFDTEDVTSVVVSYNDFYKVVRRGIPVAGLDTDNQILCQSMSILDDLIPKLKTLGAKALLLKLRKETICEMILDVLGPYGLASMPIDITFEKDTLQFNRLGWHLIKFREKQLKSSENWNFALNKYISIKYISEFEHLDEKTVMMLKELRQIPLIEDDTDNEVAYIIKCTDTLYYIELMSDDILRALRLYVEIKPYSIEDTLPVLTQYYITPKSPRFYKYYLDKLCMEQKPRPYTICKLEYAIPSYVRPTGTILYERK